MQQARFLSRLRNLLFNLGLSFKKCAETWVGVVRFFYMAFKSDFLTDRHETYLYAREASEAADRQKKQACDTNLSRRMPRDVWTRLNTSGHATKNLKIYRCYHISQKLMEGGAKQALGLTEL
ncbi:unnamed protein product [Chrysodeixis includens]|uniref:Uncharacterized protein n=1 Tax=Chrysodeixis includens TaxID=689277 RepID=A0A9P0BLG2_CHRIL|nr:unnamed protein product [Chrysodeixis includens]